MFLGVRRINKNAKLLFLGRLTSTFGDSIYRIAVIWHVYYLTNDTFYTGLATAFTMVPKVFNFLFGPWVEYHNKHKILKGSQFIQFFLMLIIPVSFYFGLENVWIILLVIACISFLENIQGTAEIAIVPQLMQKETIPKYNSLINTCQEVIDLSMKGVFGFIILFISIESLYLFNAVAFLLAAIFFTFIQYPLKNKPAQKFQLQKYKADLIAGVKYLVKPSFIFLLLPFFVYNFFAGLTSAVLPEFVDDKIGLHAYSLFLLSAGIGSATGSILSYRLSKYSIKTLMTIFPFVSFVFYLLSVLVDHGVLSMVLYGFANIPIGIINVYIVSYIQTTVSVDLLSRVVSVLDSFLVTTIPLGGVLAGILSHHLTASQQLVINSFGMLFISLYFLFVKWKEEQVQNDKSQAL